MVRRIQANKSNNGRSMGVRILRSFPSTHLTKRAKLNSEKKRISSKWNKNGKKLKTVRRNKPPPCIVPTRREIEEKKDVSLRRNRDCLNRNAPHSIFQLLQKTLLPFIACPWVDAFQIFLQTLAKALQSS